MSARIINHEKFLAIFRLRAEGLSYKAIAEQIGVGEETVRRYIVGESPVKKRDPRRCKGCGAIIVVHRCLKCELDAGTWKHKTVGATITTDKTPDENEIAERAAAIKEKHLHAMQTKVYLSPKQHRHEQYVSGIREVSTRGLR